jgi:tRNA uridine 5-carboxymethylaminomethyl modification enzyme
MLKYLQTVENLTLMEKIVNDLIIEDKTIKGIVTLDGERIESKAVVLTTGTYLASRILRGHWTSPEGPDGQQTSYGISKALRDAGFTILRLKTGTPARIKASTIDFSQTSIEYGDEKTWHYSFDKGYESITKVKAPCYLTYTNEAIHNIIKENLKESAMYGGVVEGVGPRYCPSIEDKVVKFSDKERHQIFYEPESLEIDQEYIQGFSTSMPVEIQDKMIRELPGLRNCEVIRYAYAIEYDAIDPLELWPSLETKIVNNLFTAGQINGTSGYEEAAGQGLIAGINAALKIQGKEPLVLSRDEAYIGVMIDDLITKGTKEPYRLLTSRAEYRLLLRHDNADLRLREYGYYAGTINEDEHNRLVLKKAEIERLKKVFKEVKINLHVINDNLKLDEPVKESLSLEALIKRPEVSSKDIINLLSLSNINIDIKYDNEYEIYEAVEIYLKYQGYIKKSIEQADRMKSQESKEIPSDINYDLVDNIALEAREKLKKVRPQTIGQASRISGVNPADISVLSVFVEKMRREKK